MYTMSYWPRVCIWQEGKFRWQTLTVPAICPRYGYPDQTDTVDAWMLACYGALKQPEAWTPPAEEIRHLSALLKRRDVLVSDATREKNRLEKYRATHTGSHYHICRKYADTAE